MTMRPKNLVFALALSFATPTLPQAAPQSKPPAAQPATKPAAATHGHAAPSSEGERVFQQECSRCHNPPDGFSPRISGTILQHMRVRASLSKHDEEELLRFLNP
jgi:cytochrome c5